MTADARSITEEFDVPPSSVLDRQVIDAAYFRDIYRVPLHYPGAGMVDIFFVIPFHKWGVRRLLSSALRTGRL